jgi:Icc-related predicted phosphoesterase
LRIFFATDVHGSEVCWRKFVNAGKYYGADVLILGGDMTGKAVIPIVREGNGNWSSTFLEQELVLRTEEEVRELEQTVANRGYYPIRLSREEMDAITAKADGERKAEIDRIYEAEAIGRIRRWLEFAAERVAPEGRQVYVCPGNDDFFGIDEVIEESGVVRHGEGKVWELEPGTVLVSTGWTNPTPWHTFRELPEEKLAERLDGLLKDVPNGSRVVCNIHCPPYGSSLDEAPELDAELHPKYAGRSLVPVGSTAVRDFIEKRQPFLTLHGHVHESRGLRHIGKSLCVNPGSQYEQGVLLGALIDIGKKGIERYTLTQG